MSLSSSSISLDEYGSKIWKVTRCRPAVSNETILATRQEFFFTKEAPIQSITDILLLNFWLKLLSWMFISSYTTIYFSVKKFILWNVFISVNTIFECSYLFFGWERANQLSTYATGGGMFDHPKCVQLGIGAGVSRLMCTYALTLSLFMFLAVFWSYSVSLCL